MRDNRAAAANNGQAIQTRQWKGEIPCFDGLAEVKNTGTVYLGTVCRGTVCRGTVYRER